MARFNFKEIASAKDGGGDIDQFEKFSKQFFESVLGHDIVKDPGRGADGGIDICVRVKSNSGYEHWLVSCKHYAHSGNSVGRGDEEDILDRLAEHGCDVFVGFYSTIASEGLFQKLERLRINKDIKYKIYNSEDIEKLLLDSIQGFRVAKQFFSKSLVNMWPQIISLNPTYSTSDAVEAAPNKWIVEAAFPEGSWRAYSNSAEHAALIANELVMQEIHAPMFLAAWKDAVRLFQDFFEIPCTGIDAALSWKELPPKWSAEISLTTLSPNPRWSLLAIWSLVDASKVRSILKKMDRDASQRPVDLMSFEFLSGDTGTDRRDILTRLFAYRC
ncbi:restriction endonuclease [Pseudomonas sp. C9]|uniref:restriction endonuclease n=1 Tax=Pseudomonas sp. C9 TaxID=1311337 RepID=UPI0009D505D6|nr:restriction endonuclease [Pseudomonas sp. C9]OOG11310.1 hypothetical protein BMS17_04115 [Pseudomonas sp. C9]